MKKFDLTFFVIAVCLIIILNVKLASDSGSVFLSKNLSADVTTAVQPTITVASPTSGQSISNTAPTTITWSSTGLDPSAMLNIFARTLTTGDANADGTIGFADYVVLSNHFGQKVTNGGLSGDFNGDGTVDFADEVIQSNHNGQSSDVVLASNVPNNGSAQVDLSSVPLGQAMIGVKTSDGSVKALSGVINITNTPAVTAAASTSAPAVSPYATIDQSVFNQTNATPTISGTAANLTNGIMVVLRSGSQSGPTIWFGFPSVSNGTWSRTVSPALAPGSYYVTISTNDTNINLYQGGPITVGTTNSNPAPALTPVSTPTTPTLAPTPTPAVNPVAANTQQPSVMLDSSLLNQSFTTVPTLFGTASGVTSLIVTVNSAQDNNLVYRNLSVPVVNGTWSAIVTQPLAFGAYNVSIYDVSSNLLYKGGPVTISSSQNVSQSFALSWKPIYGASGYAVYLDDTLVATTTNPVYVQAANVLLPSSTYKYIFIPLFNSNNVAPPAEYIDINTFQPLVATSVDHQSFLASVFNSIYFTLRNVLLAAAGITTQSTPLAQSQTVNTGPEQPRTTGVVFDAKPNPIEIDQTSTSTLSWNITGQNILCDLENIAPGVTPLRGINGSGSKVVSPPQTTTYDLACYDQKNKIYLNSQLQYEHNYVTVNVTPMHIDFSAKPSSIEAGATTTLSWKTTPNAPGGCTIGTSDYSFSYQGDGSGSVKVSPDKTTDYEITCAAPHFDDTKYMNDPRYNFQVTASTKVLVGVQDQNVTYAAVANQPGQIAVSWQKIQPLPGATVVYLVGRCPYPATTPTVQGFCHTIAPQVTDTAYTDTSAGSVSYGIAGLTGYRYSVTAENTYPNSNPGLYVPIPVTGNESSDPGYPNASFSKVLPLPGTQANK